MISTWTILYNKKITFIIHFITMTITVVHTQMCLTYITCVHRQVKPQIHTRYHFQY